MSTSQYDNIEEVLKALEETELINKNPYKGNGISVVVDKTTKKSINEVFKILKLLPISITESKWDETKQVIELPEFEPYYTEEQNLKIYTDSINYLIETVIKSSEVTGVTVTKQLLIRDTTKNVTDSIKMYYRMFVNPYKVKLEDFTQNTGYLTSVKNLYLSIVNNYPL